MAKRGRVHFRVEAEAEMLMVRKADQEGIRFSEWARKVLWKAVSGAQYPLCWRCSHFGKACCDECIRGRAADEEDVLERRPGTDNVEVLPVRPSASGGAAG